MFDSLVLELGAVIAAFLGIGLAIRGNRWAWPFYFHWSLLHGWLLWIVGWCSWQPRRAPLSTSAITANA
jgi:hypothetical protein